MLLIFLVVFLVTVFVFCIVLFLSSFFFLCLSNFLAEFSTNQSIKITGPYNVTYAQNGYISNVISLTKPIIPFWKTVEPWFCINCINNNIPYSNIPNNELELINQGINYNFNNNLNLNLFPTDNLNSFYTNCPNFLSNIDEANSSQNDKYYDINDFTKTKFSNNNFSILHLNISSISRHIEELKTLLSLTKHKFDIIAISESRTKINNTPINNIP